MAKMHHVCLCLSAASEEIDHSIAHRQQLKQELYLSVMVVHFDGKLLLSIAGGSEKEDRVAIIVTGLTSEKLLAIPKVALGTGEQVAKVASETISHWNLENEIVGMSFDTTANMGHRSGACILLEQRLGKKLL